MTPTRQLANSVIAGLEVIGRHKPAERDRLESEWNLSVPLAQLIKLGHVDRLTGDGREQLQQLDRQITFTIDQLERQGTP